MFMKLAAMFYFIALISGSLSGVFYACSLLVKK